MVWVRVYIRVEMFVEPACCGWVYMQVLPVQGHPHGGRLHNTGPGGG